MTKSTAHTHPDFHTDFREHFESAYVASGPTSDYASFEPYYNLGHELALDDAYEGQGYDEAQPAIRAEFERRYPELAFDSFEEAIRFGYTHTREHFS